MPSTPRFRPLSALAIACLACLVSSGCSKSTQPKIEAPTATFSMDRSAGDAPVNVSFASLATHASRVQWNFGDGATTEQANPVHNFSRRGRYQITMTAWNERGESQSTTRELLVSEMVTPLTGTTRWGAYWPTHVAGAGDFEFAGHGPDTYMDAVLSSDGSRLRLNLHMNAVEVGGDGSRAEGNWTATVYTAPAGTHISQLPLVRELHEGYRDAGFGYANSAGSVLGNFYWKGDTDGEDIRNTTTDDTHFYFYLKPFQIRVTPN